MTLEGFLENSSQILHGLFISICRTPNKLSVSVNRFSASTSSEKNQPAREDHDSVEFGWSHWLQDWIRLTGLFLTCFAPFEIGSESYVMTKYAVLFICRESFGENITELYKIYTCMTLVTNLIHSYMIYNDKLVLSKDFKQSSNRILFHVKRSCSRHSLRSVSCWDRFKFVSDMFA